MSLFRSIPLGCVAALLFGQQRVPPDEMRLRNSAWVPPVQYTLRTETRVVEVGVVVRDSRSHSAGGLTRDDFEIEDGGKKREITAFSTETSSPPAAASSARAPSVLARFTNTTDHSPAVTINKFGKGNAIYLATESKASAIGPARQLVLTARELGDHFIAARFHLHIPGRGGAQRARG